MCVKNWSNDSFMVKAVSKLKKGFGGLGFDVKNKNSTDRILPAVIKTEN